jgi:hypothetical protein
MHTVIRTYTGIPGATAQVKPKAKDLEATIRRAPGFIAYYFLETTDGITTVTVCQDRKGCDESTKLAAQWIKDNLPNVIKSPPQIIEGDLAFRFYAEQTART